MSRMTAPAEADILAASHPALDAAAHQLGCVRKQMAADRFACRAATVGKWSLKMKNTTLRERPMKVLGIKCSKKDLGWIVLEGTSRSDAGVVAHDQAKAPPQADRAETLAWGRKELLEVIEKHQPDVAALRATKGPIGSVERAEMDGYVKLIRPRPDGLMWLRSGMVGTC